MTSRTFFHARNTFKLPLAYKHDFTRSWFPSTSQAHRQVTTAVDSTSPFIFPFPFQQQPSKRPINLVNFTSAEGKRIFRGAMDQGHAESFFKLLGNFSAQSSPMLGGVSSLAMALNALEIDPKRIWKGNWRWFSGEQMKTCSSEEAVHQNGIPFDEFTCLAQTHCDVEAKRASVMGYQEFVQALEQVTSNPNSQMVVNYSRTKLGQRGHSHFSPIGGHNKAEGMTLIMDVARVEYPSVWVETRTLYEAMMETERSGLNRGYFILRPGKAQQFLKCRDCSRQCNRRRA
ncbi:hypothetical protein DFQ28_000729 [Apophysomyces sp. BC1034]|nr:hypothetical protein DFQ29_000433 [Apophysomyces sp. BC1021]KAG0168769.1 hypothetical protein DFQ30_004345 [Apophysomyces sp. BC1015]KAG0183858.1 hypothetical protein DFQ28_000729 [Apophysomyces sp. BC1034]